MTGVQTCALPIWALRFRTCSFRRLFCGLDGNRYRLDAFDSPRGRDARIFHAGGLLGIEKPNHNSVRFEQALSDGKNI